jgi:hypothetical protein
VAKHCVYTCVYAVHYREEDEKRRSLALQGFADLVKGAHAVGLRITFDTKWQDVALALADMAHGNTLIQESK